MADKTLEQMLEHLVNDEQDKAEELFHEYVVAKSREIYESLIEEEMEDDEDDEEEVDEASEKEEDEDDEKVDEEFEDIAIEADDEMDDMGGDPTDDLEGELDADMDDEGDDMEDKEPEELFQDLDAIVDELQAKFDAMQGGDEGDMDDMDDEMKDDFDLETVREYVEKVPAGHGAEKKGAAEQADNKKSAIDNMKNDMGGTTANILSSKEDSGSKGTAGGLANNKPQDMKTGNINVPGGKAGGAFSTKEPGHGAEKKGSAETADKGAGSLFRGRR
jgi:hypothetical protein